MGLYSQGIEEIHIVKHFGSFTGNLIDIGAYDGETFSNSRRLLQIGWSGCLVEPLPSAATKCRDLYSHNQKVSVLEKAIGPENKRIKFHTSEMMSTIDAVADIHKAKWHNLPFQEIEVEQITLDNLWSQVGREFDFATIDVENYNIDIARQIPLDLWNRLKCLCIEHDNHYPEIEAIASSHGFRCIFRNAENTILVK